MEILPIKEEYRVCIGVCEEQLQEEIDEYLKNDWEIFGKEFMFETLFCQTVRRVKYKVK